MNDRLFFLLKKKKFTYYSSIQKFKFLRSKIFNKRRTYTARRYLHWPVKRKNNKLIDSYFLYNSFTSNFLWIKKSYKNFFFFKNIQKIRIENIFRKIIFAKNFVKLRKKSINSFISIYRIFFFNYLIDLISFLFLKKKKVKSVFFSLFWTFRENRRLYINIQNFRKKNFFFLSHGFFLKYFEKKKSMKKNKIMKLLTARYLRKLFLLINFKRTIFFMKKIPTYLTEIINVMNTPIIHKFIDPFSGKIMEESKLKKNIFNINYFIFFKNIDFSGNKIRKKGRIKRKITRKLVLENSITD